MWCWSRRIRRCTVVRASWSRSKYTSPYWEDPRFRARQRALLLLALGCYGLAALIGAAGVAGLFGEYSGLEWIWGWR